MNPRSPLPLFSRSSPTPPTPPTGSRTRGIVSGGCSRNRGASCTIGSSGRKARGWVGGRTRRSRQHRRERRRLSTTLPSVCENHSPAFACREKREPSERWDCERILKESYTNPFHCTVNILFLLSLFTGIQVQLQRPDDVLFKGLVDMCH